MGAVFHPFQALKVSVLRPEGGPPRTRRFKDDAVREGKPQLGAEFGCGDGHVSIQVNVNELGGNITDIVV